MGLFRKMSPNLILLSAERIWGEIRKILSIKGSEAIFSLMAANVLSNTGFCFSTEGHHELSRLRFCSNYIVNLAAVITTLQQECGNLTKDSIDDILKLAKIWRLSKYEKTSLLYACYDMKANQSEVYYRREAYEEPERYALSIERLLVQRVISEDVRCELMHYLDNVKNLRLPVSSELVIDWGFEGKRLGQALAIARQKWIDSDFSASANDLRQFLSENL
jgi:tRNA nucleotidyltransferase/poly(A) polymerase